MKLVTSRLGQSELEITRVGKARLFAQSTPLSISASTGLTRPLFMAGDGLNRLLAKHYVARETASLFLPSAARSLSGMADGKKTFRPRASGRKLKPACAICKPTASTSISSTTPIHTLQSKSPGPPCKRSFRRAKYATLAYPTTPLI